MSSPSFVSRAFPPLRALSAAAATFILTTLCAGGPSRAGTLPLAVRYPSDGAHIGNVARSFVFGSTAPGAHVTVNGMTAAIAPDGGWIAYVPFTVGRFALRVRAALGGASSEVVRFVEVDEGAVPAYPAQPTIVQPGETMPLAITAAGAERVSADGPGFSGVGLAPVAGAAPGTFAGSVRATRDGIAHPSHVVYHVWSATRQYDVASRAMPEIAREPIVFGGTVIAYAPDRDSGSRPYGMLSPTPNADTEFTVPLGTQLAISGRDGNQLHIALAPDRVEWIDRREVAIDSGVHAAPSAAVVGVDTSDGADATTIVVHLRGGRVPFRVVESGPGATGFIKFFGARPARSGFAIVAFSLKQRAFWGYRSEWSGGDLVLTFRKPPVFSPAGQPALRGLHVVIDPGHAPDTGAIGPLGTFERDINLDISKRLSAKLQSVGANVVLTRTSNQAVPLYDRPALAERSSADVLISVHNNAPPDGSNPWDFRGYSVYYFQPHSRALAVAMHDAYRRNTSLRDAGLHVGDLALVRSSQLPCVLTESAFITWPWEEMQLRDASFRDRLASAMADGLERWAAHMRQVESK